jgi:hypothetical protein
MATMGEFNSLLQLGVGIGIGLSVFRAPMDIKATYLENALADEASVLNGVNTPQGLTKRGEISTLRLRFNDARVLMEKWQKPFLYATLLGAAANCFALIFASLCANYVLREREELLLIFLSVFYYVVIWITLALIAHWHFASIQKRLREIRAS